MQRKILQEYGYQSDIVLNTKNKKRKSFSSHQSSPTIGSKNKSKSSQNTLKKTKKKNQSTHATNDVSSEKLILINENKELTNQLSKLRQKMSQLMHQIDTFTNEKLMMESEMEVIKFQNQEFKESIKFYEKQLANQNNYKKSDYIFDDQQSHVSSASPITVQNNLQQYFPILLENGIFVKKYGRRGKPHFKKFRIDFQNGIIHYESGTFQINELKKIQSGVKSDILKKANIPPVNNKH